MMSVIITASKGTIKTIVERLTISFEEYGYPVPEDIVSIQNQLQKQLDDSELSCPIQKLASKD